MGATVCTTNTHFVVHTATAAKSETNACRKTTRTHTLSNCISARHRLHYMHRLYAVVVCSHVCFSECHFMNMCASVNERTSEQANKRLNGWSLHVYCGPIPWLYSAYTLARLIVCCFAQNFRLWHNRRRSLIGVHTYSVYANTAVPCSLFSYMRFYVDVDLVDGYERDEERKPTNFVRACVRFISFLFIFSLFNLLLGCFLFLLLPSSPSLSSACFPFITFYSKIIAAGYFDTLCALVLLLLWSLSLLFLLRCLYNNNNKTSHYVFWGSIRYIRYSYCVSSDHLLR